MFVDVRYDAALDQGAKASPDAPPVAEGEDGGDEATAEPAAAPEIDEAAARKGVERAGKLRQRFDKWFYVISDASFKQIHKDPGELFKALSPPAAEG